MATRSVLTKNATVTTAQCRHAVARIIRDIQSQHHLTDLDFAETVGCSVGTVRNARNEESDLGSIWINRIAAAFGPASIDPYVMLAGARCVPLEASEDTEALPSLSASVHQLCVATSAKSEGGTTLTHRELLTMLPELRAAQSALSALIVRAEKIAA
jgi:hypothetical protein